jgi:subtilisin family serine protease
MKRIAIALLLLFVSSAAFAQQTQRYIVGMKSDAAAKRAVFAERITEEFPYLGSFVVRLTDAEVQTLRKDPSVRYVERADILFFALDAPASAKRIAPTSHPTDAQVTPYGIAMVHAPNLWPIAKGDGINVAIVDTGIDYTHPELKDHYQGGFNAVTGTNDPRDDDGHGTHVAGTIGAADNGFGVVGVAPNVKLWSAKVLHPDSSGKATGSNAQIASGLNWVLSKKNALGGNWIVNMSLGQCTDVTVSDQCSQTPSLAVQTACQSLADAGVLVFAASGNDSTTTHVASVSYPGAFSSVIAVGALDSAQKIATFSNQGPEIAVAGPGVEVFSTFIVGQGVNAFLTTPNASFDNFALTGSAKGTQNGQYVYCGLGGTAADFPASVSGKIALIQRGAGITFNTKTKNALAAGAKAVVIYNCSIAATPATCGNDSFGGWTLIGKVNASTGQKDPACDNGTSSNCKDDPADLAFAWPVSIGISNADGESLRTASTASALTATTMVDDYETDSGTSMACPHAVGVAALVWSVSPTASASAVKTAIFNSTTDLGATGRDNAFGYGLLDAYAAARLLNPGAFVVHGRLAGRRGH